MPFQTFLEPAGICQKFWGVVSSPELLDSLTKQANVPATIGGRSEVANFAKTNPAPNRIVSPGNGTPMLLKNTTRKTKRHP